jgi:hypothetical protein
MFKVDPSYLKAGEVFRDMLAMPQQAGIPADGSGEDRPLELTGVAAADFKIFLDVLFPACVTSHLQLSLAHVS